MWNDLRRFTRAIVRLPAENFAEGLTAADLGPPDLETALEQHAAYVDALRECGLSVAVFDPDPAFPDSTFVEDPAVLVPECAIITRPGAPSRAGEIEALRPVLRQLFAEVRSIEAPGTLDGGDVCLAGDHVFIGISERTNEEGAGQLERILSARGYETSRVDIRGLQRLLHLKSGLAWIGERRLVRIDALAGAPAFDDWKPIDVASGEEYAANCVRVNERVLVAAGFPVLERTLREAGLDPWPIDVSEFRKMDGGLSCLSLRF